MSKTERFIERSRAVHGDKYDYSRVLYRTNKVKVCIICKVHGLFDQTPHGHLAGQGCIKCRDDGKRSSSEEFIAKAKDIHGSLYDYSKVCYISRIIKVVLICDVHNEFEISPAAHLAGGGCRKCGLISMGKLGRSSTETFINAAKAIHADLYCYDKVEYITSRLNVDIICTTHGIFSQKPQSHLNGQGCAKCVNKTEGKVYNALRAIYPDIKSQFCADWCRRARMLPFDLCIERFRIIIEVDGRQHFKQAWNWPTPEVHFKTDKYKEECANKSGYSTIRILQESVFADKDNWLAELTAAIDELKTLPAGETRNIYLCKNGEYDSYQ
jgi:hypothetical protein